MREAVGTSRSQGVLRARRAPLSALICTVAVLSFGGSASALSERGHEFGGSLGAGAGTGSGQFVHPTGVAVNERTGDVYVVDSGNNRVERFNSKHEFIEAWGWGVADGAAKLETCTSSCQRGLAGHGEGQLHSARTIAVDSNEAGTADPSGGDVYVEAVLPYEENGKTFEKAIIDKFSADGKLVEEFKSYKSEKFEEELNGIAVGRNGDFWVYYSTTFYDFGNAVEAKAAQEVLSESEGEGEPGFAFDFKASTLGGFLAAHSFGTAGTAVIAKDFMIEEQSSGGEVETVAVPETEALDALGTTGVASDPKTGDAYVDHGKTVAAFDSSGAAIQTFGEGSITEGTGIAADGATEEVFVADAASNRVQIFTHEEPGAATVDELGVGATTATESSLEALIDPHGSPASYAFRYSTGTVPVAGEACAGSCIQTPAGPAVLPVQFGHLPVKAEVTGLSPATTYHVRVFAEYEAAGKRQFAEAAGGEVTFKTQAATLGEVLPDGRHWELVSQPLKNGAAIQDMPGEGGLSQASTDGTKLTYVAEGSYATEEGEPEGNRSPEMTQLYSARSGRSWTQQVITTKNNEPKGITPGYQEYQAFSQDLSRAIVAPFGNEVLESPPLSLEATERTPYLRHNETCLSEHATCYQPLVHPGNVIGGTQFGVKVSFVSGNPSLTHVAVASTIRLTEEQSAAGPGIYDWSEGKLRFVSVTPTGAPAPEPSLAFKNNDFYDQRHAISDDGSRYVYTSTFSNGFEPLESLYLRSMKQAHSIRIDVPGAGVTQSAACTGSAVCERPTFQDASADGSTVFFTDEERLTTNSGATRGKPDLYACAVKEAEVEGSMQVTGCDLTDLSPAKPGESGNVQGNLVGAGEDGSTVYYVANGAVGGAEAGNCRSPEIEQNKELHEGEAQEFATSCDLFVVRRDGGAWSAPEVVQRLSGEDEYDWGTVQGWLEKMVSRVSPNGEWLAFMSDRNLTGYNTHDRTSGHPAEEVYLYNATTKKTICASCNPTGARPEAILDQQASGEGIGILADRGLLWTERRLAANIPSYVRISLDQAYYQARFLNNEGRLFFNSAEGLVPQDNNRKMDVYQFEPSGIATGGCSEESVTYVADRGGCVSLISSGKAEKESAFLDASETGQDVFFLSPQQIVTSDKDTSYDVYDASICWEPGEPAITGRPECILPPAASESECDEVTRSCREGATGPPPSEGVTSEGPSSGNNLSGQHEVLSSKEEAPKPKALTRAQKLKKALASCKKLKKKSKRHACEAAARKRYGAKKAKRSAHRGRGR